MPDHASGLVTNTEPETVIQEVPVERQTQIPQSMVSHAVSSETQRRLELASSRIHFQHYARSTHEPLADQLPSIKARLSHVERVLNRLAPNCLTDESVYSLQQQGASTAGSPNVQAQPCKPATDFSKPPPARLDLEGRSSDSTSFKTGGFLINNEETALTFWGSTSALGGRNNKAHLYRSIPRFVNGVLLVHVPASSNSVDKNQYRTWVDPTPKPAPFVDSSPATTTTNDTPTGALGESPAPQPQTPMKSATSATSATVNWKEFSQIIPLEMDLLEHILKNYWEQFHVSSFHTF
ncbi:hypothetical protein BC830DRAFT_867654 [Chytriomyces sp. MP71]|nr:hypothetical protein BC830DRAFT_867654 [Chytriomyces sp. MP71]